LGDLLGNFLGDLLGDFSQTHLVTLARWQNGMAAPAFCASAVFAKK
jgi:hypothetical protein